MTNLLIGCYGGAEHIMWCLGMPLIESPANTYTYCFFGMLCIYTASLCISLIL